MRHEDAMAGMNGVFKNPLCPRQTSPLSRTLEVSESSTDDGLTGFKSTLYREKPINPSCLC